MYRELIRLSMMMEQYCMCRHVENGDTDWEYIKDYSIIIGKLFTFLRTILCIFRQLLNSFPKLRQALDAAASNVSYFAP